MPDKRIYHFQTPRTTPTNGLKSDFFWWFMRFVRVPLMKVGQIGPTFLVPEKTVNFFRVKPAVSSFTLKMRKSHKKLARVYAYTHAYTQIRDGGGKYAPPPVIIGLTRKNIDRLDISSSGLVPFIRLKKANSDDLSSSFLRQLWGRIKYRKIFADLLLHLLH